MSAQPYPDVRAFGTSDAAIAPTKQEQKAIVLLKDQDAAIVCAYLRVARALGGGSDLSNGQSVLTEDEVHAVLALSGREDNIVWSWLLNAQGATDAANVCRPYSCTVCGSQRSYQNHSDWKKHEKEHEVTYICMIGSSQEASQIIGAKTESHNICDFFCKRRDHMVTHLHKRHEIHKVAQARTLASQWRRTTGKMFWSCGFCIRLFRTFAERLKHIGSEHYERNQTYEEWDTTKLIRGLLLQPGVQIAWGAILATGPVHHFGEFVWDRRTGEEIRYLLEMGPSPTQSAESLAMAAYKAGKLKTESLQSASALSISSAPIEAVEIDVGNPSIMLHSPMSRRPNVERIPAHAASNDTSIASPNSAYWTASTSNVFDESYKESKSSKHEIHMPSGTPSSEYNDWFGLGLESCSAPESPLSYATQTFST